MPPHTLTNEIIIAAITGFESQKTRIDAQIAELRAVLDGGSAEAAAMPEPPTHGRKRFSAAARQRMKEAQQRRWAKIRGESEQRSLPVTEPSKPKRKLSAAGKAAIVAALKKRWAAKRAAMKAAPAAAKKAVKKKAVPTRAAEA